MESSRAEDSWTDSCLISGAADTFRLMSGRRWRAPRRNRGWKKQVQPLSCLTLWKSYMFSCRTKDV